MGFISSKIHGVIDYGTALLLLVAPYLFGFADGGAAQWVPMLLGLSIIIYSLLTDYELAAARKIPLPVHLVLDFGGGALLAVSPWLFGFADVVFWPHLLVGIFERVVSAGTRREPDDRIGWTGRRV